MSISLYQASAPVFLRALGNLKHVLGKGEAALRAKGVDDAGILGMRLIPDMLPLSRQVQIAADMTMRGIARLAGQEPASVSDTEATVAELNARIDQAMDYVRGFQPAQIDGNETRSIQLKMRGQELNFEAHSYLLHFVLPNLFFHCTTVYNLLRGAGVELGKMDFLGNA